MIKRPLQPSVHYTLYYNKLYPVRYIRLLTGSHATDPKIHSQLYLGSSSVIMNNVYTMQTGVVFPHHLTESSELPGNQHRQAVPILGMMDSGLCWAVIRYLA